MLHHYSDWIRLCSLYLHVLISAVAIVLVLGTDWAICRGQLTHRDLIVISRKISILLVALWISGAMVIYIDTAFEWENILNNSKLTMKLLCVVVLTFNGMLLHYITFPILRGNSPFSSKEIALIATTGSLSTGHWLLAILIGLADMAKRFTFESLLTAYLCFIVLLLASALVLVRLLGGRITGLIKRQPA